MAFKIHIVKITFKALDELSLPTFSGSSFRGVFGHSLKNLSCLNLNDDCNRCQFTEACIYSRIFESSGEKMDTHPIFGSNSNIPHPYIIKSEGGGNIPQGMEFNVKLVIFGEFINWSQYIFKAFQNAGKNGVGKGNKKFELISIKDDNTGKLIYKAGNWLGAVNTIDITSKLFSDFLDKVEIKYVTPLRIIKKKKLVENLSINIFFNEASRRIQMLNHYYGDKTELYNYNELKNVLLRAKINSNLKMLSFNRYSNRQNKFIPISGLTGNIIFSDLEAPLPGLLNCLQFIGLGKGTVHGLGQFQILNVKG